MGVPVLRERKREKGRGKEGEGGRENCALCK